jgi:hypothetical protein
VEPSSTSEQSAYDKWLDQTSTREAAGSTGSTARWRDPTPLWIVLFFISAVIFVFMLFLPTAASGL